MSFSKIWNIIKQGFRSLYTDYNGRRRGRYYRFFWLLLLPIIILFLVWGKSMSNETIGTILTILGIFTSLLFGVIFIAPDKLNERVLRYRNDPNESTQYYLKRFANFTKLFVSRLSFIISLCIFLILSLISLLIIPNDLKFILLLINSLSVFVFYYVVLALIILVTDIYTLLNDDIDQALHG